MSSQLTLDLQGAPVSLGATTTLRLSVQVTSHVTACCEAPTRLRSPNGSPGLFCASCWAQVTSADDVVDHEFRMGPENIARYRELCRNDNKG